MVRWLLSLFAGVALCVTSVGKAVRRFRPSKAFVIVIVLAVVAEVVLVVCGVPPTVGVQVVAAVLGGVEAVRRLTATSLAALPGAAR